MSECGVDVGRGGWYKGVLSIESKRGRVNRSCGMAGWLSVGG